MVRFVRANVLRAEWTHKRKVARQLLFCNRVGVSIPPLTFSSLIEHCIPTASSHNRPHNSPTMVNY